MSHDEYSSLSHYIWHYTTNSVRRSTSLHTGSFSRTRCNVHPFYNVNRTDTFSVTLCFIAGTNSFFTLSLWWSLREERKTRGLPLERRNVIEVIVNDPMLLLTALRSFLQMLNYLAKIGTITAVLSICAIVVYCIWPKSRGRYKSYTSVIAFTNSSSGGSIFLRIVGQAYTLTVLFILLDRPESYARSELPIAEDSRNDPGMCKSAITILFAVLTTFPLQGLRRSPSVIPRTPSPVAFRHPEVRHFQVTVCDDGGPIFDFSVCAIVVVKKRIQGELTERR